ncbi:IS21 family transposase [Acidihalobacter ferrooxydans]
MPTPRVPMRKIHEVLRLKHDAGLSHAKIARAVGLSKGAVSKYISLTAAQGIGWPTALTEAQLEARLFPAAPRASERVEPDFAALHTELKRKGVTRQLLWSEYVAAAGDRAYRYSQYCQLYRDWRARQRRSMRQVHRAGEKTFFDYAGPTVPVIDPASGEIRRAQVFVAVLGASSYTYAEATWTQSLPDWIGSHRRALEFFGGSSALWVPDNLKSAVAQASRYDPTPNSTYAEMAQHYGAAILPARPYKPKDKAKVEVGVQLVERWILARLRHRRFFSLGELNAAIRTLLDALNHRPFQKQPHSRAELFEALDKPALKPLPAQAYEYAEWRVAKPGIDYHLAIGDKLYSVPHALVGHKLDVRLTAATVEVFHKGHRVAVHPRDIPGRHATIPDHMPKSHRAHAQWSPGRFLNWASDIGPSTHAVVRHQLHDRPHPEHGYRACLGLLSHARRYGKARLEAACRRALMIGAPTYRSITSILAKGLDQQTPHETDATPLPDHANVRGAGYYH